MPDRLGDIIAQLSTPPATQTPAPKDTDTRLLDVISQLEEPRMSGPSLTQMRRFAEEHSRMGLDYGSSETHTSALKPGSLAAATGRSAALGTLRGILSPLSSLFPATWSRMNVQMQEDELTLKGYMDSAAGTKVLTGPFGAPTETTRSVLTAAPAFLGEQLGWLVPGTPMMKGAEKIARATTTGVLAQRLTSAAASATAFTALAEIEPGESRAAKVGEQMIMFGALDLGLRMFGKATREELGADLMRVVSTVSKKTGASPSAALDAVVKIRANPAEAATNVKAAEAILEAGAANPNVRNTPAYVNAGKIYENWMDRTIPKNIQADPLLGKGFGVKFNLTIGDKPLQPVHLTSSAQDVQKFGRDAEAIRAQIEQAWKQGIPVKIENVQVADQGALSRFMNIMYRRTAPGKGRKVPGAAPANTVAVTGNMPKVGDKVKMQTEGGLVEVEVVDGPLERAAKVQATETGPNPDERFFVDGPKVNAPTEPAVPKPVAAPPAPAPSGTPANAVWVKDSKGNVQLANAAALRVTLPKPGEHVNIKPHPDGSPRHGIININERDYENQLNVESYGDTSQSYFRDEMFYTNDMDTPYGSGVRAFFNDDHVVLSVTPGEHIWETKPYSPMGEYGWDDSVEWLRAKSQSRGSRKGKSARGELAGSETEQVLKLVNRGDKTGRAVVTQALGPDGKPATRITRPPADLAEPLGQGDWSNSPAFAGEQNVTGTAGPTIGARRSTEQMLRFGPVENPDGSVRFLSPRPMNKKWVPQAGYIPRPMRNERYVKDFRSPTGWRTEVTEFEGRELVRQNPYEPNLPEETIPHAQSPSRAAYKARLQPSPAGYPRSSRIGEVVEPERTAWPTYDLTPEMYGHAELIDAQKAARILLRHGAPDDMPVAVVAAYERHTNEMADVPWTLRELADYEPPQISISRLRDEAAPRGIEVFPDGKKMILRAKDRSWERTFDSHLEAARWVTTQPGAAYVNRLDDPIELSLGIGRSRSFDADKDASRFVGVELQELAANELVQGKRPLISLHSSNPAAVDASIRSLEKLHGLPEGTYKVVQVPGGGHGGPGIVVYDPLKVKQTILAVRPQLAELGIDVTKGVEHVVKEMSEKPWGLDAFMGRPEGPLQALHYTWLREHGMKEAWQRGLLKEDALGSYRVFSEEDMLLARRGGPGSPFAGGEPPKHTSDANLEDIIEGFPRDARMYMPDEPPMFHPNEEDPELIDNLFKFSKDGAAFYEERVKLGYIPSKGPLGWVSQFFRVPSEMFKDWQAKTGVPFWDWYNTVESARSNVEATYGKLQINMQELFRGTTRDLRESAQQVFDSIVQGRPQDITHITDDAAHQLGRQSYDLFIRWIGEELKIDKQDAIDLLKELPQVRKSGVSFSAYKAQRGGLPKLMTLLSSSFEKGEVQINNREMDLKKNLVRLGRAMVNEEHMQGPYEAIRKQFNAWRGAVNPVTDDEAFWVFDRYIRQVFHQPDFLQSSLAKVFRGVSEKLERAGVISDADAADYVSYVLGANYFANMAFAPGIVLRNALQTFQTGMGLGTKAWKGGFDELMRWVRDDGKFEEELIHRGILTRDRTAQMWGDVKEVNELITGLEGSQSKVISKLANVTSKGQSWFKKVDDGNRVLAYYAQYKPALKEAQAFIEGKKTWEQFLEDSMIDMRDTKNGPLHRAIREALDRGDAEVAAHMAATDYMLATQFQYRRGTVPLWMQNTLGRFAGQYGTWPSYFVEFARNTAFRGSIKNRTKVVARWSATNAAMYTVARDMFGIDASRWLFFSPFGYAGGPAVQIAQQTNAAWNQQVNPSNDPVQIMQAQRLQSAWQQFTPLPMGQFNKTMKAFDAIQNEDYTKGIKYFLGFPEAKE